MKEALAREILAKHTDDSDHSCTACGDNSQPAGWVEWPCDAVRLARLVLGETHYAVTDANNSFWIGRDPMTGMAVMARLQPGQYTEVEVNEWIRGERDKLKVAISSR